ncbi:hypothetical protein [Geomonas anaerohicana]|uniref:hypothetical protein n=1 Tax=Geomonas anaerohicana TaxID=2798583 RepID=UPI001F2287BD|nr:hypothetical protein [Geomonas anaerohicana]
MQYDYYRNYDRKVNKKHYHELTRPFLEDAKALYRWAVDPRSDSGGFHKVKNGPLVVITGRPANRPGKQRSAAADKAPGNDVHLPSPSGRGPG